MRRSRVVRALAAVSVMVAAMTVGVAVSTPPVGARPRQAEPAAAPEAAPVLKADYKFKNNRRSLSPSAPALFDVGSGGQSSFIADDVDGTDRIVLDFPEANGLQLVNADHTIPRNRYTIVVKFRFDDVTGYRRVIDFSRALSDKGPYVLNGAFVFHPNALGSPVTIDAGEWVNVVLTRSQAGRLRGYVDGQQVFDVTDPNAGKINHLNTLRFFRDNDNREESGGAVSRIRLYDNGMTPAQVAALGT